MNIDIEKKIIKPLRVINIMLIFSACCVNSTSMSKQTPTIGVHCKTNQ